MKIDVGKFQELVEQKYLSVQPHGLVDLKIWNYTQKCQFEKHWTPETMMARGLITDSEGTIIARPFSKFFNLSEHENKALPTIPLEPFTVQEKFDGSLGILFWVEDTPYLATRGSFVSDQAKKGTEMLWKMGGIYEADRTKTYLFEIIYPENRIVVDYGKREDLILLAVIDTETGKNEDIYEYSLDGPFAGHVKDVTAFDQLLTMPSDNKEGFVITFQSGMRVKVKFDEYVRLHRLITGVNAKTIWELLRNKQPFDELLERVPDEFMQWVKDTKAKLEQRYKEIEFGCAGIMLGIGLEIQLIYGDGSGKQLLSETEYKKQFALRAINAPYSAVLFAMKDKKDYAKIIWQTLKPTADKPFTKDIDA
jgi:RNA ligase